MIYDVVQYLHSLRKREPQQENRRIVDVCLMLSVYLWVVSKAVFI